jgi:integrase/recombinase XerD
MQLSDALTGYWLDKRTVFSPHTVTDYSLTFDRLIEFLGPTTEIEGVTSDDLRRFLAHVKKCYKLGDKTTVNVWIALSSLWTWADKELGIPQIVHRVEKPSVRRPPVEPFSRHEIAALLEASGRNAPRPSRGGKQFTVTRPTALRDRAILLTLLDTGLRSSELCNLKVGDLDLARDQLRVRQGKGRKDRFVYLGQAARKAIWKYLTTRSPAPAQNAPLFATRTGSHLDTNALGNLIEACAKRAGVEGAHPHRFRHTFAITFLRNGGSPLELQAILGHEKLDTVTIYARLAQVDLQAAQRRASPADGWAL